MFADAVRPPGLGYDDSDCTDTLEHQRQRMEENLRQAAVKKAAEEAEAQIYKANYAAAQATKNRT